MSLHSNLVLFKSLKALRQGEDLQLYIPIWFYSNLERVGTTDFPYILYIPIWFYSNVRRLQIRYINATFTFQSGSIQIGYGEVKYMNGTGLYIPIWLYSNQNPMDAFICRFFFTFQSGYIQM